MSCASERNATGLPGEIHHTCESRQLTMGLEKRLIHSNKPSNQVADSRSHFSRGNKRARQILEQQNPVQSVALRVFNVLCLQRSISGPTSEHTVHAEGGRRVIFWIGEDIVLTEELHSSPLGTTTKTAIKFSVVTASSSAPPSP